MYREQIFVSPSSRASFFLPVFSFSTSILSPSLTRDLLRAQGLYPALIVVLVDFQRSIWDEMYAGTSQMDSRFGYDSRLRFASTDSEAVGVNLQLTQLTTDIAASGSEDYNPSSFKKASLGGEESQPT